MSQSERFEILVPGSGAGGKLLAWHMARAGRRTAVVERRWIGGSCPNITCLPSKNEIRSAKVASLVRRGAEFGAKTGRVAIDMATVRDRKRAMVDHQIAAHLRNYKESGTELIMGSGRFVAPKALVAAGGKPMEQMTPAEARAVLVSSVTVDLPKADVSERVVSERLKGVAPALIQTAEMHVLRDEGEAYARKLDQAGVDVTSTRYNGLIHDYGLLDSISQVPGVRSAMLHATGELKQRLAAVD